MKGLTSSGFFLRMLARPDEGEEELSPSVGAILL